MGKWSRHPLGSDRALDIQDIFFNILMQNEDPDSYYLDLGREEIRNRLLSLKVDEIKQHIALNEDLKNNRFVIPYSYLEFDVLSVDKDICTLLKDCLKYHAMFTYKDTVEINHINRFIAHFDEVFAGTYDLNNDKGLIKTIEEANKELINISDDYFGIDYDFSKYLKCGVCGEIFKKKQQKRNALYLCNARYKKGSKGCVNKGVPDDKLVEAINSILNISSFDPQVFEKMIKEIIVLENNELEFHFHNGTDKETNWENRDNKEQWSLAKRAESRIKSMQSMNADDYPLRDKLICGDCGNFYVHKKKENGYVYVCRTNRRKKTDQCSNISYKEQDILDFICRVLNIDTFNKDIFNKKIKHLVLYPNKTIKVVFSDDSIDSKIIPLKDNKSL